MEKGKKKEKKKWTESSRFLILDIDLMLKVHLAVTVFPHSPSDVLRKQQVMAMTSKVGVNCRTYTDGRWVCCQSTKKRRVWRRREGGRNGEWQEGWGKKKNRRVKEMKREKWRIKEVTGGR